MIFLKKLFSSGKTAGFSLRMRASNLLPREKMIPRTLVRRESFFCITVCTLLVAAVCLSSQSAVIFAQSEEFKQETLEGVVTQIIEEKEVEGEAGLQWYQKLELKITKGSLKDQTIISENGLVPSYQIQRYKKGDKVVITYSQNAGQDVFSISDYVRRSPLLWLFIVFVIVTALVAKWRGISSFIGMGISFLVIFYFILPRISAGANPVLIAILGSLGIIPATFYFSHGLNKKTTVAILGTLVSLVLTGFLAAFCIEVTKLTGLNSEEVGLLQTIKQGAINTKGLLLAGIMIGVLGVMDDITISQAAIVFQLNKADTKMKVGELYKRAMDVGQDHIASMVNTLILVYTGAALPLLLLFINNPRPFAEIVNYEPIGSEIVRTLVGSIGLILAVPITTILSVLSVKKKEGRLKY